MRLNLGCGPRKLPGYVNVDLQPEVAPDVQLDIGRDPWPWDDNSVDGALASHIMEHLPGEAFFHFLRELYRVCKNGAEVTVVVPHPRHDSFLGDPTHVRPIIPATLVMLSKRYAAEGRKIGQIRTPFGEYLNVDFELDPKLQYSFDPAVDLDDPELEWKAKHLNNIILETRMTLRAIK